MDKPAEHVQHSRTVSMSQDIAAREPAPAIPHRSIDQSRAPSMHNAGQDRTTNDVWTSAISRLQAQVSYNTGMLESHRRQFTEIEAAIGRLNQQMGEVVHAVNDVQRELRVRPMPAEQLPRHDSGDLEVLAGQLQRLTNRVNEIDGMNMQLDLVKNRVKRLEEGGVAGASTQHRPLTATYSREQATQDTPVSIYSQQQQHQQQAHHFQPQQQASQAQQHAPLPPMRTASMASPGDSRPLNFPGPGTLESQSAHPLRPSSESRPFSAEQPPSASQFRPNETLPPPSALSGWRPAEHHGLPAIRSSSDHHPGRLATAEPDLRPMHSSQAGGWAAVNTNPAMKRPPDDRASPYQSPSLDGSKRPRLAPLMPSSAPRSIQSSDAYGPAQSSFQAMIPSPAEVPFHPRSRAPSDGSQSRSAATPGPSSGPGQHSFRFITSAQQAEGSPDMWRPEMAGGPPPQHAPPPGRGGGRRGGGRGRGRGRGRGGGGGPDRHGSGHEGQEHGTPEWERPETVTGQSSPNSGYQSIHPHSPKSAYRSTPGGGRGSGFVGGPPERQNEFPATPVNPGSPHDSYTTQPDATSGGSGKKTRTKPIRNAEGILIRKDGRPDMRSVSSANNLRKVHAKKEAERGDGDGEADSFRTC